MSKLFDQLKDAARSREEKSPGLLADALERQRQGPAVPVPPPEPPATAADTPQPLAIPLAPPRISRFSGAGLAFLIFIVAVLAWRSAPFTPPRKHKIDPSELRLDRNLDLHRVSPKGTSPAGRPS